MKVSCRTITGTLHSLNKGASDWGWQGLIAYGCQNVVVVIDPKTVQVLQILDRHRGQVVKVKWAHQNYHHDMLHPYNLQLASADTNGKICVWNVANGVTKVEFSDSSKPVADMEWLNIPDSSNDLLAVLHQPYALILWNAETGTKIWKKTYTEVLNSFAFDPFDYSNLTFLGQECIVIVDDFSVSKVPSSNGKKYFISSPGNQSQGSNSGSSGSAGDSKTAEKRSSRTTITRRMSNMLVGESNKKTTGPEEDIGGVNECLQLIYHRACKNHLILVYPREISILDLDINQTVGIIPMERTGCPFNQVFPLKQRDALLCLHENGAVSVRVRRRTTPTATPSSSSDQTLSITPTQNADDFTQYTQNDLNYDLRCQSDSLRITKHYRVFGMVCCPVSEAKVSLIMSDGKLQVLQLTTVEFEGSKQQIPTSPLYTPGPVIGASSKTIFGEHNTIDVPFPKTTLAEMISQSQNFTTESQSQEKHGVMLKFIVDGLHCGLLEPPFVIRMCPPLTTKNWTYYQPLLAVGSSTGVVQVYNLSSGEIQREFSTHTCAVRGIEWVSLQSFLSFAYQSPGFGSSVKNELSLTDIQTGRTVNFRGNRDEDAPIEMLRISYLKQYFVVMIKDKPFELWDLRTATLIRQMPRNFPHVTALEWLPSNSAKNLKKRPTQEGAGAQAAQEQAPSTETLELTTKADNKAGQSSAPVKEHFVFTDAEGHLFHFMVEGNIIKEGSRVPPDGSMGTISTIAWKGEQIVMGDVDGNLNLWDLKARVTRTIPTHRGWVKKLRFAPGRGNMKLLVLHNEGVDIWDAKDVEHFSSVKSKDISSKIIDVDWAASDKPVMACEDGTIKVMNLELKEAVSPIHEYSLAEMPFCPHLLSPKGVFTLKFMLQCQQWKETYDFNLEETDENRDIHSAVKDQLEVLDEEIKEYLPICHLGIAQRCLITARLFGDESEIIFWTVALHYLRMEKADPLSKSGMSRSASYTSSGDLFIPTPQQETKNLLQFEGEDEKEEESFAYLKDKPLETHFDILCDNQSFQKYQMDRTAVHDSKRATYEHTKQCAENLMLLGQADRAVQLLLETEADNENYYIDSLRACLVASIRSSGASQSTIKLVATNLIANGKLSEGVQLLCLINKGMDACRYLQTYGHWEKAAWLAKSTLDFSEASEVLKRWADHLYSPSVGQKNKAVLLMLTLGQFERAIEMLHEMRQFDRAALFMEACIEFGLFSESDSKTKTQLKEKVFVDYARLLIRLGMKNACAYYCNLAGAKGSQLMKDIESMLTG